MVELYLNMISFIGLFKTLLDIYDGNFLRKQWTAKI